MVAVLRLLARLSSVQGELCGLVLGASAQVPYLGLVRYHEANALAPVLLTLGTVGLGTSIGVRLPALLRSRLRRRELSGTLGPAWHKLTRDVIKNVDREDLAEDHRRQRLIEAYADAFKDLPTSPAHAKVRMAEAIALSEDLLKRNSPQVGKACGQDISKDPRPPSASNLKEENA